MTPAFTCRTSTLPSRTTSRRASSPSRSKAVAGTPTPSRRASSTWPEAKAPIWARETSLKRDPDLAGAARLVDLLVHEADAARDRALDARQLQFRRHADGERASVCSGTSASRSIAPSSMMRNSGSPEVEAEAPSLADRRLTSPATGAFTSVRPMRT